MATRPRVAQLSRRARKIVFKSFAPAFDSGIVRAIYEAETEHRLINNLLIKDKRLLNIGSIHINCCLLSSIAEIGKPQ